MLFEATKGIKNVGVLGWGLQRSVQVKNLKDSFVKSCACVYVFLMMVQRKKIVEKKAEILLSTPQTKINQNTTIPTKNQVLSTTVDNQTQGISSLHWKKKRCHQASNIMLR